MAKNPHNSINMPGKPEKEASLIPSGVLLTVSLTSFWLSSVLDKTRSLLNPFPSFTSGTLSVAGIVTLAVGIGLGIRWFKRRGEQRKLKIFRRYANAIGDRDTVSIRELAAHLNLKPNDVAADLQAMIDQGYIGGKAYIDYSHMVLYMEPVPVGEEGFGKGGEFLKNVINVFVDPEERAKTVAAAKVIRDQFAPHAAPRAQARPAEEPRNPQPRQPEPEKPLDADDYDGYLRQIKRLNDQIADKNVSAKIDRIGELTASIFAVVREKPEQAGEVRKFMSYYLPTTLKLLNSYRLMEKQSYQGENIQASRKKIENVMDTLVHGFEQQQDRLFRTEALDVETDITVLETMLAHDGLTDQSLGTLRAGGGTK